MKHTIQKLSGMEVLLALSLSEARLNEASDQKAEKAAYQALKEADDEEMLLDMADKGKQAYEANY